MTGGRLNASQLVLVLAASSVPAIPARADEPRIDEAAIEAYTTTELKKGGYPSLSIGIVDGQGLHFAKGYGLADRASGRQATPESLYYIGSVTKVFTTTLMCILRDRGILRLDDPISKYLPEGVKLPSDPRGAPEITLRHLATHTSGLPRLPPNLTAKGRDPYGGYTVEQLYAGLGQVKLVRPVGAECRYSTLGAGLLGHVLERAAGEPYEKLLAKHLLDPLGMKDTSVTLTSRQRRMLTVGYKGRDFRKKASPWNFGCLEGAGALVSSVADLARFLSLQLKAGQADVRPVSGGTLTELHTPQRLTGGWDGAVGLGWHITPAEGIGDVVWHNGGVDGHFAFIGFLRDPAIGVIVLTNAGKLVDQIGWVLLALAAARPKPPTSTTQALPAAQEILDAHVAATGGREARERIHNVVKRGAANIAGMQARFESYNAEPARAYMKMSMGPLTIAEEGVDGTIAWEITPQEGASLMTGDQRDLALRQAVLHGELKWPELYKQARCTGLADFGGRRCYEVVMTPKKGPPETMYYDLADHLLIGVKYTLELDVFGEQTIEEIYTDYKAFDGILYACTVVHKIAGMELTFTTETIEHNVDIPAERFNLPPDVRKLLSESPASQPAPPE